MLFTWVQFLKEDVLRFLNIHNLLELPSDDLETSHVSCEGDVSAPSDLSASGPAHLPPCTSEPSAKNGSLPNSPGKSQDEGQRPTVSTPFLSPSQRLLSQILINNATQQQKRFESTVFDCGVCFLGYLGSDCVKLPECGHIFCRGCLTEFCKVLITEGNVRGVSCPQADCPSAPTPAQVHASALVLLQGFGILSGSCFFDCMHLMTRLVKQVQTLVGEDLFGRYDRLLLQNTLERMSGMCSTFS